MTLAQFFFYVFSIIAVASELMVIESRNPVHTVLFLIMCFVNAAGDAAIRAGRHREWRYPLARAAAGRRLVHHDAADDRIGGGADQPDGGQHKGARPGALHALRVPVPRSSRRAAGRHGWGDRADAAAQGHRPAAERGAPDVEHARRGARTRL